VQPDSCPTLLIWSGCGELICGFTGRIARIGALSLCRPGSDAGDHEGLDGRDELGCPVRVGADLAQDLPVLQLSVDPLAWSSHAGVGGVDLPLRRRQAPIAAGVRIKTSPPLRNRHLRSGSLGCAARRVVE
jgi:hypothetical protein